MGQQYIRGLPSGPRLQASLGRNQEDVYRAGDSVSDLLLAQVVKVNYVYNTVDVITTRYNERFIKGKDSAGRFSARLPMPFGGSLANGMVYGMSTPVNIGDIVLIGFISADKNSPIVMGIYPDSSITSALSPTDAYSGDGENSKLFSDVQSFYNYYPSQVYDFVDGQGNREITFPGESFLKTATGVQGNGRLNDYGYTYDYLSHYKLRGQDVHPLNLAAPQVLLQHTNKVHDFFNTLFLDDSGLLRISHYNTTNRGDLEISDSGNIRLRGQVGSILPNDMSSTSVSGEVGVYNGIPKLLNGTHSLVVQSDGFYIDGQPAKEYIESYISDLTDDVQKLAETVQSINDIVSQLDLDQLKTMVKTFNDLVTLTEKMGGDITTISGQVSKLITVTSQLTEFQEQQQKLNTDVSTKLDTMSQTLADAAGTSTSLALRLQQMQSDIDSATHFVSTPLTGSLQGLSCGSINRQVTMTGTVTIPSIGSLSGTLDPSLYPVSNVYAYGFSGSIPVKVSILTSGTVSFTALGSLASDSSLDISINWFTEKPI